jgi:ABC-type sugar transport system permease subunit/ABC-type glycerol-3-phosphate transport system substrate-binding protein
MSTKRVVHLRFPSTSFRRRGQIPLWFALVLMGLLVLAVVVWTYKSTHHQRADGRQEIVFWNAVHLGPEIYTALHEFELENPQYHVIASTSVSPDLTGDGQRLLCATAGGVPPDLVFFDRFAIGEWASRGALTDLTPYIQDQKKNDPYRIDLSQYYPLTLEEARYRAPGSNAPAQLYGLPTGLDIRMLFINADHLRQAGLVDPKTHEPIPPKTWEELRRYASLLTKRDDKGRITRLGFAPNFGNSWLYMYAFEAGGNLLNDDGTRVTMDSPPVARALRYMMDVYDDLGGAKQVDGFQSSFQSGTLDPFLQGQVSMKIDGDWSLEMIAAWKRDMDFIIVPAPIPADRLAAGNQPITWAGGWSLVIPSTAKQKDGAFKLIQFLSSRKMYQFTEMGNRETAESEGRIYLPHPNANRVFYEALVKQQIEDNPEIPPRFKQAYAVMKQLLPRTMIRPPSPVGQLLWSQHIRAYDAAVNHSLADESRDKDDEVHRCLASMQVDVQRQLDTVIQLPPPTQVEWGGYFWGYAAVVVISFIAMFVAYKRYRKPYSYKAGEVGMAMVFMSPWLIGIICLTGGPILFSIVMSFTRYDVLSSARYVGGGNYGELLHDPVFYKSLFNTAFMLLRIPLGMAASLAIAMLLNRRIRGIGAYRTAFYMPTIVPLVASALLWQFLLNPSFGLINVCLMWLLNSPPFHGMEWVINHVHHFSDGPFHFLAPAWLNDPSWSKPSLILMALWSAGGGMIIWLAGLQSIPTQLYEAATVDGASKWRQFLHVTIPMLSPYILFNFIIGVIGTMQIFGEAYIMTSGGPADSTLFYAYYLFKQAFQFFRMGYASALAWILFIIVLALTLVQLWASKKWVHYDQT